MLVGGDGIKFIVCMLYFESCKYIKMWHIKQYQAYLVSCVSIKNLFKSKVCNQHEKFIWKYISLTFLKATCYAPISVLSQRAAEILWGLNQQTVSSHNNFRGNPPCSRRTHW